MSEAKKVFDKIGTANPVFYRTYSRRSDAGRESWAQVAGRTIAGLVSVGKLTAEEESLLREQYSALTSLPSGRWLWVGGTQWIEDPANYPGAFNCSSTNITDWRAVALLMDLAMTGCGTGAVLEERYISQLPVVLNKLNVKTIGEFGTSVEKRDHTEVVISEDQVIIRVGDSRQGWVESYQFLLELSSNHAFDGEINVVVDISAVRPAGEILKGFGGLSNPAKLPEVYTRCAKVLNRAVGRKLTATECCLVIGESAIAVVAGNIRRSAGMRQGEQFDTEFSESKDNLWVEGEDGKWRIDDDRDALRTANHTRVYHQKPTEQECIDAVRKQFYSGEGAIQYAPEAIARANADILTDDRLRKGFIAAYERSPEAGRGYLWTASANCAIDYEIDSLESDHRLERLGLNPCITADAWIHTEMGARQVKELIGKQHRVYVDGELFSTTPDGFFLTGVKPVVRLKAEEGYELRLTINHQLMKVVHQTQDTQASRWAEVGQLKSGDRVLLHNQSLSRWEGCNDPPTSYSVIPGAEHERSSFSVYRSSLEKIFDSNSTMSFVDSKPIIKLSGNGLTRSHQQCIQRMLLRIGIVSTIQGLDECCELTIAGSNLGVFQSKIKGLYFNTLELQEERFTATVLEIVPDGEESVYDCTVPDPGRFDANGFVAHNCGEIIGSNFFCNLSEVHLNRLDPTDLKGQEDAFRAAGLGVAVLLNYKFQEPRYQVARELDPIVGVSLTGLFDFFVTAFGADWLEWWKAGRPEHWGKEVAYTPLDYKFSQSYSSEVFQSELFTIREREYLKRWKAAAFNAVWEYCDRHSLKRPNRCTALQPAGTKSLLTGASAGWHPPKAQRYIRRITFRKDDPVALACIDYGYSVIPSQSDKDEQGNLLDDPFDPRCTEWLVEIPVEVPWANLPGADTVEIEKFSALAQFDFYMQVQKYYVTHNASSTIELTQEEIEPLGRRIHQAIANDEGYISSTLLARFDAPFPRLPFEKIDKETYERLNQEVLNRRRTDDFHAALAQYDRGFSAAEGPAGCDGDKCLIGGAK